MAQGGKPKADGKRMLAVKVRQATWVALAELEVARLRQGRPYGETTKSQVVEDAINALAASELGTAVATSASQALTGQALLALEHQQYMADSGYHGMPMSGFIHVRNRGIEKGDWPYPKPIAVAPAPAPAPASPPPMAPAVEAAGAVVDKEVDCDPG